MLVETVQNVVEFLVFGLKIDDFLFEFGYLRQTFMVQILQVLILSESLKMSPDFLGISLGQFRL